jgi:hypothetical protein
MANQQGSDCAIPESDRLAQELCGHTVDQLIGFLARADEDVSLDDTDSRAYWVG